MKSDWRERFEEEFGMRFEYESVKERVTDFIEAELRRQHDEDVKQFAEYLGFILDMKGSK